MQKELTTLFTGRNRITLGATQSTNRYLSSLSDRENLSEGTIVTADYQEEGQGLGGARWYSEPGLNLLVSVLLRPDFLPVKKIYLISKAVALAIKDYLAEENIIAKIKWPNDIYVEERKICGALIENTIRGSYILQSIIGIGLNINQLVFPEEIPNPVSMKMITGINRDTKTGLNKLCHHLEKRYFQLKSENFNLVNNDYLKSLHRFYEMESYESKSEKFFGQIIDVTDEGQLVLKKQNGSIHRFSFKEIRFL